MHQDKKSNFKDLLQKGKAVSVHMKSLQYYKIYTKIYELRGGIHLANRHVGICIQKNFGIDTVFNLRTKIGKLILDKINDLSRLSVFESNIKFWSIKKYHCRFSWCLSRSLAESTLMEFLFLSICYLNILLWMFPNLFRKFFT